MKLDEKTINILNNFQTINTAIVVNPGNILSTISESETIIARAVVPDTFEKQFAIYDLPKFLAILSLSKENDIDFHDEYLIIKQSNSKVKYRYAHPDNIKVPPATIKSYKSYCQFRLPYSLLQNTLKAIQILKYTELAIQGDNGKLYISAIKSGDEEATSYSTEIGETDKTFNCIIEADKLKLINVDYDITISDNGLVNFKSDTVEYFIAMNGKSTFES